MLRVSLVTPSLQYCWGQVGAAIPSRVIICAVQLQCCRSRQYSLKAIMLHHRDRFEDLQHFGQIRVMSEGLDGFGMVNSSSSLFHQNFVLPIARSGAFKRSATSHDMRSRDEVLVGYHIVPPLPAELAILMLHETIAERIANLRDDAVHREGNPSMAQLRRVEIVQALCLPRLQWHITAG